MAYSFQALLDAPKELMSSIIKLRREHTDDNIDGYHKTYQYLTNVCNGYIETAPFQVYYNQLKPILDDAGIDQQKLANSRIYNLLKNLNDAIVEFVKDIQHPYKSC